MNEYKSYIDDLASNGKDSVFLNSSPAHASYVMSRIFKYSNNEVRIWAGSLSGDVSMDVDYIEELYSYLKYRGTLFILLTKYDSKKKPGVFSLLQAFPEKVFIKNTSTRALDGKAGREVHFTVGDGRMYRLENDIDRFLASGNFNDRSTASKLEKMFDLTFSDSSSSQVEL